MVVVCGLAFVVVLAGRVGGSVRSAYASMCVCSLASTPTSGFSGMLWLTTSSVLRIRMMTPMATKTAAVPNTALPAANAGLLAVPASLLINFAAFLLRVPFPFAALVAFPLDAFEACVRHAQVSVARASTASKTKELHMCTRAAN